MKCKVCGKEIIDNVHDGVCEECHQEVLKRIESEEQYNKTEVKEPKKEDKFYKKWWFWVIIILLVIVCGSDSNDGNKTNILNSTNKTNIGTMSKKAINSTTNTNVEKIKVTVIDFSQMSKEDIQSWCNTNKVVCNITESYSDTMEKGTFISQSSQANSEIYEGDKITIIYSLGKEPTLGQKNALSEAKSYLNYTAFSYKGLIEQLKYEGYSAEESTYGADNCGADWNEQAAKMAKQYINYTSFSRAGLIEQLEYEGFTAEQAEYGATTVGY